MVMGCCACDCFDPIADFFGNLNSRYLKPIVENPIFEFFFTHIFPIIEFFIPISATSVFLLILLRPGNAVPRVDAAVVTVFSLDNATSTTLLGYDIAVELSFHNRKYLEARYLDLTAVASYGGTRLGPSLDVLPVFVQPSNATDVVHAVFQGAAVRLGPAAAKLYEEEAAAGEFTVLVTVASTFMYDVLVKKVIYYYDHECYIRFPAAHAAALTPSPGPGAFCNAIAR